MLVRRIARPLLAAPFVYGGISTLRKPQDRVPGARPVVEKIAETADKQLPVQVPRDVEQWVKADAAVKVVAGSLFGLGRLPRLTALVLSASIVPTTLAGHRFWEEEDEMRRAQQRIHFFKNLSMLGGLMLAAVDTEGQPGLAWRAQHATQHATTGTRRGARTARREAKLAARGARAHLPG